MRMLGLVIGTGILLLASAAGALWMGAALVAVEVVIFAWSVIWMLLLRTRLDRRYEHVVSLFTAAVVVLAYALGAWALNDDYVRWANRWNVLISGNLSFAGLGLPQTAEGAIPLVNALMLFVWTWIKAIILVYPRSSNVAPDSLLGMAYGWAYQKVGGEFKLKPWWHFGKWAGGAMATIGVGLLVREWWAIRSALQPVWFALIPCSLIMLGVEWHLWLSGQHRETAEPEFGDGVETATPATVLDDLWCRYRARWPGAWRAAGNKPPEADNG